MPLRLGDPVDRAQDGAESVDVQRSGVVGPMEFGFSVFERRSGGGGGIAERPAFDSVGGDAEDQSCLITFFDWTTVVGHAWACLPCVATDIFLFILFGCSKISTKGGGAIGLGWLVPTKDSPESNLQALKVRLVREGSLCVRWAWLVLRGRSRGLPCHA